MSENVKKGLAHYASTKDDYDDWERDINKRLSEHGKEVN